VVFEDRARRLLDLEEQRILLVATHQQRDVRARADAADPDDLPRRVDELEPLEQPPPVVLQGRPERAQLVAKDRLDLVRGDAVLVTTIGGWLTIR
jgi:hypothetical protein